MCKSNICISPLRDPTNDLKYAGKHSPHCPYYWPAAVAAAVAVAAGIAETESLPVPWESLMSRSLEPTLLWHPTLSPGCR